MNLLAHLHLGTDLPPLGAAGNLMSDFCKEPGSEPFQVGVARHQHIDQFTDRHPVVMKARQCMPASHRRYAPILIDLIFDLCLVRSWDQWHTDMDCEQFIDEQLKHVTDIADALPASAQYALQKMKEENWLHQYQTPAGLVKAVDRVILRRPRLKGMRITESFIDQYYEKINVHFSAFYPELRASVIESANLS